MERADLLEVGEPLVEESKFSLVIVGHCPHCGSPVWAKRPKELQSDPPKNEYSCECLALVQAKLKNEAILPHLYLPPPSPQLTFPPPQWPEVDQTQPMTYPPMTYPLPGIQINPAPLVGMAPGSTWTTTTATDGVIDFESNLNVTFNGPLVQNKADSDLDGLREFSYVNFDG